MKPEKQREDDEANCLSPIDEDASSLAPDGVDPKAVQDHELANGAADGLVAEDATSYEAGLDGVGSDSLIGSDGSDSAYALRRHRHNVKEKERKEKIKLDMQEIQNLLPPSQVTDKRQTMHELLQLGIQHLRFLTEQNNQLVSSGGGNINELERLRKENEELKLESSRYRGLIATAGLPVGVDPSQLMITWRYRTIEEINNPFLYAPSGQQMTTNILPAAPVENGQQQMAQGMAQGMAQQFNGQISYATGDPSTSQYMMYTDLLNSSDPSCMGLATNEPQNGFPSHGASLVTHNGQLMLVSQQPQQVQMQALPMTPCQSGQGVEHPQPSDYPTANGETTIDRKQIEESGDGPSLSGICQMNGAMECAGTNGAEAVASENSGGTEDTEAQVTDGAGCPDTISIQDAVSASDQPQSVEVQSGNQQFFSSSASAVQPTLIMNNAVIYRDGSSTTFDPSGEHGAVGMATSSSCSLVTTNPGADSQLQGNYGGQSVVLHNGQVLLVNQNQNMGPQPLGPPMNGQVIGQDFSGGFCQGANPQFSAANLSLQSAPNQANTVFLNKPNQFSSQSMTFYPGHSPALPPALLQPPLASNQTVTVNTPQGPMIMHTLPSKPNEHPQALILPDGQIVPVVTQPNLLFPPQQCIPVTGSLLVPSVTPSRMAPSAMQGAAQSALAAKPFDGKCQTFALPQSSAMQLGGVNLQPFSSIVSHVLSGGVDSTKLYTTAPLQAVPAQGHLPLPTLQQPCSSASKSSRSKKKSVTATTAAKTSHRPQSYTAMVMPEGNILLLPGGDVTQSPSTSGHAKPSQRPLMPKPMPKADAIVAQPLVTVSQSPLIGGVPIATAQLAPGQVVSGGQQLTAPMMTPLTISLPNQPILPFGCAQIPPANVNSTDILAQATESLFTISPNNQNQASDIFTKDIADDQLHIDIGSMAPVDCGAQAEVERPAEKLKKSKKKKNAKAKPVEEPSSGIVDQQNMQFNLFSPGAKHDEEKESDITDFADLIRMEPPTPAPAKGSETSDGLPAPVNEEAGAADGAKSSVAVADELPGASESCVESSISSESAHGVDITATTACGTNGDPALILSSKDAVPSESLNILPPTGLTAKNSDNPKASCTDINDKRQLKEEKAVADATGGRKTSPRKKKSNKASDNLQPVKNPLPEADKCSSNITPSNSCHQLNNSEISDSTVETSIKSSLRSAGNVTERLEKTAPAREPETTRAPSSTAEQPHRALPHNSDPVKTEKLQANGKEKRSSGRSSKKEKPKVEVSTEEENQNGVVSGSAIEPDLPEETDSGNRRGFALSNFLPAARQPSTASKAVDATRSCKGHKKSRQLEDTNVNEPPGLETEAVQTTEEATQTVKKELRSRHRHGSESDGRGKKRQKKCPAEPTEQASEELPETLSFAESEIFDVIDKVENMAVATQTEPKRKSHGRKHKSNCERDGGSSSKRKKKTHDNVESSVSVLEQQHDAENSSILADAKTKDCAITTINTAVTASEPKCIDVFSFDAGDCSGKVENQAISFKMSSKKQEEANALDKDNKNTRDSDILKPRERSSPKPVLCGGVSQSSSTSASTVSKSKSKFSFFAPSTSNGTISSAENKSKMSSSSSEVSKSGSPSVEVLPPKTSLDIVSSKLKSVESSVSVVASSVPEVSSCNSTSDVGSFQRSAELSAASTLSAASVWSGSPAAQVPSSGAVDVPYSKASEVPMTSTALSMSNILSSASSSKVSAGKARHSNIVSLTGSLTPKSAVTKLTSHSQRSKVEREVPKDAATATREPEKNLKSTKNRENESQSATAVPNSSSSTEAQHCAAAKDAVAKDTVSAETVDSSRGSKPDKERARQEREPISSSAERCAGDSFVQDVLPASNASHYVPPAPVLVQCAYNETHQKSRTPSTVSSHSTPSADPGISVSSSRSGFSQKSGGTQAASQNGMHSKMTSSYNSAGSGLDMERKSWHEESRRRNEAEYYPSAMSSAVLSCAVQNKNSTPYSCPSAFPTADKIGMAHQQPEGGNFSGSFGGLAQNSFYPQPSSYRGLEQLSPCGGDNMSRGTMSSCSVDKHSSNAKTGNNTSNDSSSIRRDMAKTNQHESYFTPQFLEPTVSPALNSMSRDKSSCLGTSMQSQTSSRQPVPHSSSTTGHSRSHARSPSTVDHQSSYPALSGYHGASGSLATSMLQHHLSPDYGRYSYNNQHSFGFDMFQTPGSQFNPNLAGLTFDPPPLNVFRDCGSVGMQGGGVKTSASKLLDAGGFEASKSMPTTSRTASSSQPTSNPSQSCKSGSNRSASKSTSSASTKKSVKPSSSYGMESGMLDGRCVTPFIGLGSLSPSRTVPPETLSYFAPPNLFGNAARTLPSAKTLQHRDAPLPLNAALFSPSRAAQNGFGLNFQTGFAMDHVHGSHMGSSQVIAPPPSANAMPAHMHGFGFGNIFSDIGGATQRDHLSMSPIKLAGGMDTGTLHHHHHHQGAGSMYNGRGQLPAHMLSDMGFNPFLGPQHPGFDARGIGTPFGGLWT